ncbi:MAG TPA: acyl carrier protein [Bryobacteraceae bacterium]|nr:acyl carrier protein [Bryobacteraceae bacterium]
MELETQIKAYMSEHLIYVDYADEWDNDTSLLGEGLIDSIGIVDLLSYIQAVYGIRVEQHEITPEHFDSVNRLAAFVRRKQAAAQAAGCGGGFAMGASALQTME